MIGPVVGLLLAGAVWTAAGAQTVLPAPLTTRLELVGRISPRCALELDADPAATRLDLQRGVAHLRVARITERCNGAYGVTLVSRNGGVLRATTGASVEVPYLVDYDGVIGALQAPLRVARSTPAAAREAELSVTLAPAPRALPGTYADVVTLTIAAD